MDVPGECVDQGLEKGLQGNTGEFCQLDECDDKYVPAEGFCQTCGDYLCAECFKVHTISLSFRNHVLLDKGNMPRTSPRTKKSETTCTFTCPDHNGKEIEFFCPTHSVVLCVVCAVIKHQQCDTVHIPEEAETYKESKEFADLLDTINNLDADIKLLSTSIKEAMPSLRETTAKTIKEIQQFRKELNDYLNKKEQELILATKRMEQEDTRLLQGLTDELDSLKEENSSFMKQLKSAETKITDLFVTSKQLMKKVQSVLDRFIRCAKKNKDISYTFAQGHALKDLLKSRADFGEIKKNGHLRDVNYFNKNILDMLPTSINFTSKEVERKSDIKMKAKEDITTPRITGMVLLSPGTLLLTDIQNYSVKTVDTTSNTILSRLSFSSPPWDVALLPQDRVAVTLYNDKKIQIISTKDTLSAVRNIDVDGHCYGISATKDSLIVSFANPSKVNIMNFHGTVVVSVRADRDGEDLFSCPLHNTIVVEGKVPVIHVSDCMKNSITKLSIGGQVLATYNHTENWNGPWGMTATGNGQLLVCNYGNHTVDVISEGGKLIQTLLDSTRGIQSPESICYCVEQNILYVSNYSDGTVQVYRFT